MDERVSAIETGIKELRVVLGGEPLTGKPGVLQNQMRMLNALFDEKEGAIPRLTSIERRELQRTSWVKGAWFAWTVFGALIGFTVSIVLKLIK
jgi:hypothetical protein